MERDNLLFIDLQLISKTKWPYRFSCLQAVPRQLHSTNKLYHSSSCLNLKDKLQGSLAKWADYTTRDTILSFPNRSMNPFFKRKTLSISLGGTP